MAEEHKWSGKDEIDAAIKGHTDGHITDDEAVSRGAQIGRMLFADFKTKDTDTDQDSKR